MPPSVVFKIKPSESATVVEPLEAYPVLASTKWISLINSCVTYSNFASHVAPLSELKSEVP